MIKQHLRPIAMVAALFALLTAQAYATAVVVPPGLNPGDTYRIIFLTSTQRDALSTDINDYNQFVTDAANLDAGLQGLGTSFKVLGSTAAVNALDNAGLSLSDSTTRFYNTLGQLVATGVFGPQGSSALYGDILHPNLITTESGDIVNHFAWTGTGGSAESGPEVLGGPSSPRTGWTFLTYYAWTDGGSFFSSNTPLHFYGVSDELTVATPEPSTLAMLVSAMVALGIAGKRRLRK